MIKYYKENWHTILASIFGTAVMLLTFYFAAVTIYGDI